MIYIHRYICRFAWYVIMDDIYSYLATSQRLMDQLVIAKRNDTK
jgi:hypothetical protein